MQNRPFSIIIKVKNLQLCRNFYESLPGFGAPVAVSSFAVIFQLTGGLRFILVQSNAIYLDHGSSATAWSLEVPDLNEFQKYMDSNNAIFDPVEFSLGGERFFRGVDPEGNVFFIKQSSAL